MTAVFVLIASPSDLADARASAMEAMVQWNAHHCEQVGVVYVPLLWESAVVPQFGVGESPQTLINRQLLDRADVVIAMFGSRVGTPTDGELSGTLVEIREARAAGKPVHLYFSSAPHPNDVDPGQLAALHEVKQAVQNEGLYGSFDGAADLGYKISFVLTRDAAGFSPRDQPPQTTTSADPIAQDQEQSRQETDSKGRVRSRTHRWIEVTNRGARPALDLSVTPTSHGIILHEDDRPRTLYDGQTRKYTYMRTAGADEPAVLVRWRDDEGGEIQERRFDL